MKRYEQFKFFVKFAKNANLRAISPCERCSLNFLTKKVSQPLRNLVIKKKRYQKTMRWMVIFTPLDFLYFQV